MSAVKTGNARDYAKRAALYSLARVPGREKDALCTRHEITRRTVATPSDSFRASIHPKVSR